MWVSIVRLKPFDSRVYRRIVVWAVLSPPFTRRTDEPEQIHRRCKVGRRSRVHQSWRCVLPGELAASRAPAVSRLLMETSVLGFPERGHGAQLRSIFGATTPKHQGQPGTIRDQKTKPGITVDDPVRSAKPPPRGGRAPRLWPRTSICQPRRTSPAASATSTAASRLSAATPRSARRSARPVRLRTP